MRKAGVSNYVKFAKKLTKTIKNKSISLEVFSDDNKEIIKQSVFLSNLAPNVYKNTNSKLQGNSMIPVIKKLSSKKIKLNITAIMTFDQVKKVTKVLDKKTNNYISIFAGRIADTGRDPIKIMDKSLKHIKKIKNLK